MTAVDTNKAPTGVTEPVNRSRRSYFIFLVVGYALVSATAFTALAGLGILSAQTAMITLYVEAALGLAGIATVAYVGGSSIDYNGGIGNMFRRSSATDPYAPPRQEEAKG